MRNSIVNIESISNNSFGTGFVIDSDEEGIYILTSAHVLDDVEIPMVENVLANVVVKSSFVDMAVLYLPKLDLKALPLQIEMCKGLEVEVIGFSIFTQNLTQKKHIKATLYPELIELHSKKDNLFYTVRKIKAHDGFKFERGNSGSPVICSNSGQVIAMISNKEGAEIAYAIDIKNIKEVWREMPTRLLGGEEKIYSIKSTTTENRAKSSIRKYLLSSIVTLVLGGAIYLWIHTFGN